MIYRSTRLTEAHDASAFDCGSDALNPWLTGHALRDERAGMTATTV